MHINLIELWSNMSLAVHCVVFVLTVQAVACVAVVIDRMVMLYTSSARSERFAADVQQLMEQRNYPKVLEQIEQTQSNHLTSYLEAGLRTFVQLTQAGESAPKAAEYARRALERKGEAVSRDLNRRMNVLASTGSTAPFVGLLGTVLGIINAFKMIAATGSGGIGTIGAAIGEALVVTGYGLIVAIPSVLLFNWIAGRIATFEGGLLNAGGELVDRLERFSPSVPSSAQYHPSSEPLPAVNVPRPPFVMPKVR
jgi:biopolymer transport protein ExbB/TolQ